MTKQDMLRSIKINNPGLEENFIKAFTMIDRAFFLKQNPYLDIPLEIAHGQTISQPTTIARMLRILKLDKKIDVLEIGTNTGYHAALTSYLVYPGTVYTIEIFPDLAKNAKENIIRLKKKVKQAKKLKIKVYAGSALDKKTEVWKHKYDRIYFTASVDKNQVKQVHDMAKKLLRERGFLLYPTQESYGYGFLELWQLKNKKLEMIYQEKGYSFVPLQGK